jgi:L-aminopeptidase/D-esterase-like protein
MHSDLTAIPNLLVGHWTSRADGTGCTVVLCPHEGAVAGVDVRGGAPGTRETDLLRPECTVERIHAIMLAGGSAYGLAAADGAMRWLEEQGIGYDVGIARVPIVPAAVLFDLPVIRPDRRPNAEAGYAACANATSGPVAQGSVGAGTGASVGKIKGLQLACKGGLGCAAMRTTGGVIVAALAVVNAYGNVYDPQTGQVVGGARRHDEQGNLIGFYDPVAEMAETVRPSFAGLNTTLAVVATNGRLNKSEVTKMAQMAHDGMARAIRPVHSGIDGDVVFALSCGETPLYADLAGALAADVLAQAIVNALLAADSLGGMPAVCDLEVGRRNVI